MTETAGGQDHELFQRSRTGEEAAFIALYRRWQGAVYRYALRLTGSPPVAEDVTQEVFLALMNPSPGFDPARGSFSAWIHGVARHQVLRRIARESLFALVSHDSADGSPDPLETRDRRPDPWHALAAQERIDLLHGALAALPLRYREVVILCELQELNYLDAAQVIGCPEGTIRSRLHRARALLLKKLQEMTRASAPAADIEPARCVL